MKKLLALVLVVVMAFSCLILASCGDKKEETSGGYSWSKPSYSSESRRSNVGLVSVYNEHAKSTEF